MATPKKSTPAAKKVLFEGRLKSPDARITSRYSGTTPVVLTLDSSLKNEKIDSFGFETDAPPVFRVFLSRSCSLFVRQTQTDAESLTLRVFTDFVIPTMEEKEYVSFVWNAIQDVIARLPFDDPLSRTVQKISKLHDEFPLGDMGMDSED